MADGQPEAVGWPSSCRRRWSIPTCTTTRSRRRTRLWCGPLGYQGSKAAMKLIARADVVLALGTRLGPFGTLPQHGIDYWPKDAKIIQVDADPRMLGLVKPISVGICGDAKRCGAGPARPARGPCAGRRRATATARLADVKAEKAAWETELDGWALEKDRGRSKYRRADAHAPAPDAARARTRAAGRRDGVHRHRQHLLGRRTATCASSGRARCSRR